MSLLARYSQSRRDEQPNLPGGTGAAAAPGQVRSSATLELCCHPTCLCTPTPCNPPRWGRLPPEAVAQAPALPLPLIYCSALPQTKPLLCRLLSESGWQVGRGQGEEGPWSRWNLSLGSNERGLRRAPASLNNIPKQTTGLSLQPLRQTAIQFLPGVRCWPGHSDQESQAVRSVYVAVPPHLCS